MRPALYGRCEGGAWSLTRLAYIILPLLLSCIGWLAYRHEKALIESKAADQLGAVVDLKVMQIERWVHVWKRNAVIMSRHSGLAYAFDAYQKNGKNLNAQITERVKAELDVLGNALNTVGISLFDTAGSAVLSTGPDTENDLSQHLAEVREAISLNQVVISLLHLKTNHPHLELYTPVTVLDSDGFETTIGALGVSIDPEEFLFPLLRKWPTPSKTAESLLVTRDKDDVVYLNELRFKKGSGLNLRSPIAESDLPAAAAVQGIQGLIEGVDYRGVQVLASVAPVPDTLWFVETKIDKREVYAPLTQWVLIIAAGVLILSGLGISVIHLLLTKQATASAKENEARLQRYLDVAGVLMVVIGRDKKVKLINVKGCSLLGVSDRSEVLGEDWFERFVPESLREEQTKLFDRILSGEAGLEHLESRVATTDGGQRVIRWYNSVLYDSGGKINSVLSAGEDITAQKENERMLIEARQKAEREANAKSEFLANMSHEIRTPLNAIVGFAETLQDRSLSPAEQSQCASTILRNSLYLMDVVNDILDLSKIEAGRIEVERVSTCVLRVAEDVLELMRQSASEKGLILRDEFVYPLPSRIMTDKTRVKQVLLNLIGNAIKFTDAGCVTLRIGVDSATETMWFEVADSGRGISAAEVERIFEPFYQGTLPEKQRLHGTGLGLTISKRLARLLGGDLQLHSEVGKGTRCILTISTGHLSLAPYVHDDAWKSSESAAVQLLDRPPRLEGRVLLMEDNKDTQRLMSYLIRGTGAEVIVANNGRVGVEAALQDKFDLVIADMHMPEMDGCAAIEALRKNGLKVPVVAVSADAVKDRIQRCMEVGCDDYFVKPFERKKLYGILSRYLKPFRAAIGKDREMDDDPEYRSIVREFVSGIPERIADMQAALDEGRITSVGEAAHKLATAALFGYPDLGRCAKELQKAAEAGDVAAVEKTYERLCGLTDAMRGNSA